MGYKDWDLADIINYLYENNSYIEFDYLNNRMKISLVDEYSNEKIYSHKFLGGIWKYIMSNNEKNI